MALNTHDVFLDYLTKLPKTLWSAKTGPFDDGTALLASTRTTCGRRWLQWGKSRHCISRLVRKWEDNAISALEGKMMGLQHTSCEFGNSSLTAGICRLSGHHGWIMGSTIIEASV